MYPLRHPQQVHNPVCYSFTIGNISPLVRDSCHIRPYPLENSGSRPLSHR
ncbi:hypothetical protein LY78DRAFT_333480 [Colletotrichum sublineola]|nr:hypothetical protein LY78DRAFT_333480 [Colletotrichum sublineola]